MHQLLYFSKIILSHENQYFGTQLFLKNFLFPPSSLRALLSLPDSNPCLIQTPDPPGWLEHHSRRAFISSKFSI